MNASEARRQRREEERTERRRSERLAEKAERDAEEEREAERAEARRRQAAREEAEATAAEESARERRAQRLAAVRRERAVAARRAQAREERRRVARSERAEGQREQQRRAAASQREVTDRRQQRVQEQRAAERQAEAEQAAGQERRRQQTAEDEAAARSEETRRAREEERRARAREEEQAAQRAAELRTADAARRAEDRRSSEAEAQRREQLLEEQRRELLEERRRREREAEARAERLREAREAKLRGLAQERAAEEADRERAEERRAREARRREAERRAQAQRESRQRERRAGARASEQEVTELPWLRTEDGRVVEWGGEARVLRGVNVVGLDEAAAGETPLLEALALDDRNLEVLTDGWGVSVVRVPFSAGTILGGSPVLDRLDELVGALAGSNVYALLALRPPEGLPDQGTHDVWTLLADRYQAQPGALFEPYAAEAPLGDDWPEAALELVRTIRSIHQSSLLLLPGADLEGLALAVPNLVYTLRDTSGSRPRLDERFAAFARSNPVLVSEWANEGPDLGRSAIANAGLFERLDIGWCACNWNAPPRLVAEPSLHRFAETRFGLIVRRALAAPVRPALSPYY